MDSKKKVTRQIDNIVLHHSAGESTANQIRNDHINTRGWSDIFYHYIIERDGKIVKGRDINVFSNRRRQKSIEICIIGRLHKREIYKEQKQALGKLLTKLKWQHNIVDIKGHNEHSATICPGNLDVEYFRRLFSGM